jgi:predicted GIY-YIG superfamily endonuclease
MLQCAVYWLFDDRRGCPWRHGYSGISTKLSARLKQHRNDKRKGKSASGVPTIFDCQILFRGSTAECVAIENQMRPVQGVGWNRARGGRQPYLGYKHSDETRQLLSKQKRGRKGVPNSPEMRAKISARQRKRYADPAERAKVGARTKDYWRDNDHLSGAKNPRFGVRLSDETKAKIGRANSKTICKRGHQKEVGKQCRECQRYHCRKWYLKKRTAALNTTIT